MTSHEMSTLSPDQVTGYMREAVALSLAEVERGGIPFSGLVVHPRGGVLGSGVNRVLADRDPSTHAEIVALRAAAETAGPAAQYGFDYRSSYQRVDRTRGGRATRQLWRVGSRYSSPTIKTFWAVAVLLGQSKRCAELDHHS